MSKLTVEVENFKPRRSNTLFGFADILIPELRLRIFDLSVHEKNGQRWVGLPGKPQLNRDGTVRKDLRGKNACIPMVEFTDKATRDAFSERTIKALVAAFPDAFDEEEAVA